MTWLKILIVGFLFCTLVPSSPARENVRREIGWLQNPIAEQPEDWLVRIQSTGFNMDSNQTEPRQAPMSNDDFVKLLDSCVNPPRLFHHVRVLTEIAGKTNEEMGRPVRIFVTDKANRHFPLLPVWLH